MDNNKIYYNELYKNKKYGIGGDCGFNKFKTVLDVINKYNLKYTNVLDIGCGSGLFLNTFLTKAKNKYGIDISEEALKNSKNSNIITKCVNLNTEEINLGKQFDTIFCMDVLEHLYLPLDVMFKIKKVLKPGGYLIITLPNDISNIQKKLKIIFETTPILDYNQGHIRFFNVKLIKKLIKESGFKLVKITSEGKIPFQNYFPNVLGHGYIILVKKETSN